MIQLLVNIDVPDLEAATRFYVEAFGFTAGRRMGPEFRELLGAAVPIDRRADRRDVIFA